LMSAAYRQSSRVTPEKLAKDPANRLLSRGPRYRLDAEMLRDQALFVSGLLVEHVGGPSVKPPQPAGLWEAVGYTDSNTARFQDRAELGSALKDLTAHYASQPDAAKQLINVGETKPDPRFNPGELAAWTMIGNVVLNLDEVITKG